VDRDSEQWTGIVERGGIQWTATMYKVRRQWTGIGIGVVEKDRVLYSGQRLYTAERDSRKYRGTVN
jgi:hypothetical protein